MCRLVLFCAFLAFVEGKTCLKGPRVSTNSGEYHGIYNQSRNARLFASFRGIPYAKPPIGPLRFQAPQPLETSSSKQVDATQDGPYCIQKNYFVASNPPVEGQEDCLYLNVYVPQVQTTKQRVLPVMVFIHWGGFIAGRSSSDLLGPEYLMDEDIVLVTFNYRLGPFAFLSTLDDNAAGNYALKDQRAALQWIQQNIEQFGGDRNRVTLFGQSAGSGSVHAHILSSSSRDLFHRAISQSGTALNLWMAPRNDLQLRVALAQAALVNCTHTNHTMLIECLRTVPAKDLLDSGQAFKIIGMDPVAVFGMVVETKTPQNPIPFIEKTPREIIASGDFNRVPWIVGTVQDEGVLRVASLVRQQAQRDEFNAKPELFQEMLGLSLSTANVASLLANITDFYLEGNAKIEVANAKNLQGFVDLYTDRSFAFGIYQTAVLHATHQPVWFYEFKYRGESTYGDYFAGTDAAQTVAFDWGVCHCDDLLYLFESRAIFPEGQNTSPISRELVGMMTRMWGTFAASGKPSVGDLIDWKPLLNSTDMENANFRSLSIDGSAADHSIGMSMQAGFRPKRMRFWLNQDLSENIKGIN